MGSWNFAHPQANGLGHTSPGQRPGFITRELVMQAEGLPHPLSQSRARVDCAGIRLLGDALSGLGLAFRGVLTQGVALGWYERPLRGHWAVLYRAERCLAQRLSGKDESPVPLLNR